MSLFVTPKIFQVFVCSVFALGFGSSFARAETTSTVAVAAGELSDSEPIFRLSLPTEDDYTAWRSPGLRVSLGYGFGNIYGSNGVPEGSSNSFMLRAGARLDRDWSLMGSIRYAITAGGLRYLGLIEPTYELLPGLSISAGAGLAGFVIADQSLPVPPADGIVATYTYADDEPVLSGCSGEGVAASVRVAYSMVVGSLFSTGPALSFNAQATRCAQSLGNADPDTGRAIELEQYWYHRGLSFDWMLQWR